MPIDALRLTRTFRLTGIAAVVLAALAPTTHAQSTTDSCGELRDMVVEAGDRLRNDFSDAPLVAQRGDLAECSLYVIRVTEVGGLIDRGEVDESEGGEVAAQTEAAESVTETMQIEQAATIEGEVNVTLPDPEVDIEQRPAEISVRSEPAEVTIDQPQPRITVRQAQPIITVQMEQPTIIVEQPAPEIIVTMPDPGVSVANAQPSIEVNIPEPLVTVRQGEPRLNVDLDTTSGSTTDAMAAPDPDLQRMDEDGVMTVSKRGMSSDALAPVITYRDGDGEPAVSINGASPDVEYVAAEPDVRFSNEGEPTIEVVQSGEPKIVVQASAADARSSGDESNDGTITETAALNRDLRDPRDAFASDPSDAAFDSAVNLTVTVEELDGMDVINGRGETLGNVERVVRNGSDTYLIVEHGGWFLGLNDKEVAFPIDTVLVRDDNVILRGMSETQIESMPDYDYDNEVNLAGEQRIELMSIAE